MTTVVYCWCIIGLVIVGTLAGFSMHYVYQVVVFGSFWPHAGLCCGCDPNLMLAFLMVS